MYIVISCEHGGNRIPDKYDHLFDNADKILESHRGWDIGVNKIAEKISSEFESPLFQTQISRLLVDCNRSDFRPDLFSNYTNHLGEEIKSEILREYYYPYRKNVEQYVDQKIAENKLVLHLSMHTFTPSLNGEERTAEIGLLFDDQNPRESNFCKKWKDLLDLDLQELRIALNYPYRGTPDGFTSYFRRKHSNRYYIGVEVEVNQKLVFDNEIETVIEALSKTLRECIKDIT